MTGARRGPAATRPVAAAVLGVLVAPLLLLVVGLVAAAPAEATTYRYWTYWWGRPGATGWRYASQGPGSDAPGDTWVLGWRFGVTSAQGGGAQPPRASHVYADLCHDSAPPSGQVRLAVVVDYGTTADAPPGETPPGGGTVRVECVTVTAGTGGGFRALSAAGIDVRVGSDGFVCGIDGYPRTECSAAVADPTPSPTASSAPPRPSATAAARPATPTTRSTSTAPSRTPSASPSRSAVVASGASTVASAAAAATSVPPSTQQPAASAPEPDVTAASLLPVTSGAPVAAGATGSSSPVGAVLGLLAVAAVGSGAWWTARRSRGAP